MVGSVGPTVLHASPTTAVRGPDLLGPDHLAHAQLLVIVHDPLGDLVTEGAIRDHRIDREPRAVCAVRAIRWATAERVDLGGLIAQGVVDLHGGFRHAAVGAGVTALFGGDAAAGAAGVVRVPGATRTAGVPGVTGALGVTRVPRVRTRVGLGEVLGADRSEERRVGKEWIASSSRINARIR